MEDELGNGWEIVNFEDLMPGDITKDENGHPVLIKKAYDIHIPEKMYQIETDSGQIIKASGNHLWYIITPEDKLNHHSRLNSAKLFLDGMPPELKEGLANLAENEEEYEVTLLDLVDLFDYKITDPLHTYSEGAYFLVHRILASIGHIVEYTQSYQDLSTGETLDDEMEKLYDGRRAAQQILSLSGNKIYRKKWPVIMGRVVTTDEIFEKYPDAEIPEMKSNQGFLSRVFKSKNI